MQLNPFHKRFIPKILMGNSDISFSQVGVRHLSGCTRFNDPHHSMLYNMSLRLKSFVYFRKTPSRGPEQWMVNGLLLSGCVFSCWGKLGFATETLFISFAYNGTPLVQGRSHQRQRTELPQFVLCMYIKLSSIHPAGVGTEERYDKSNEAQFTLPSMFTKDSSILGSIPRQPNP